MARFSGQAIVIGGSISGLLSARILADHFEQVLVLERDLIPTKPIPRKGVPQSVHSHLLLVQGVKILEQLFPGFCEQLKARGAVPIDLLADYLCQTEGDIWIPRFQSGVITYGCTRNLIENLIRERLGEFHNFKIRDRHQVLKLKTDPNQKSIEGVICRPLQDNASHISAQLVVDASGRSSKSPQWLQLIGYKKPDEARIDPILTYGSRLYSPPANFERDWKGILLGSQGSNNPRSAILISVENNCWLVTLGGYGKVQPPQKDAEFLDFVRQLRSSILFEALKDAKPITPVYRYRGTINRRRYFEALPRWPENFVVIGDAACAFNPTHGKGITNAALSALCLNQILENQPANTLMGFSRKFQQQLATLNSKTWDEVLERDSNLHTIKTDPSAWSLNQLLQPYLIQVIKAAQSNPQIFQKVIETIHQIRPKTSLFEQDVVSEVVKNMATPDSQRKSNSFSNKIPKRQASLAEMEKQLHHRYIYTNNVRLHYVTQGEGPLIILLHGFPEFWYSWRHQILEFSQDHKVIALDLRGYNDSDKPKDVHAYCISELIKDIQGVIKGLGYDQCILVGHDWGGAISWSFAYSHPEMIQKMIILNCPHPAKFYKALQSNPLQMLKSWYIKFFQLPLLPELLFQADDYRAITSVFVDGSKNKISFSPKDIEIFKDAAAKRGAIAAMLNYYRSNSNFLNREEWGILKIPTLLLWGEDDIALGKELTYGTKGYVQDLQLEYIQNCGHWIQQEQPELVNKHIRTFLRQP